MGLAVAAALTARRHRAAASATGNEGVMGYEETRSDNDRIQCPACGESITDLWDYRWSGNADAIETECGSCGVMIRISRHISIRYTARKL